MASRNSISRTMVVLALTVLLTATVISIIPWTGVEGTPAPGWAIEVRDSNGTVGEYSSMALDSKDKIHISYYDQTKGNLKYTTNAGGSWATSIIDSEGDVGRYTSIAVDSDDKIHISYFDVSKGNLKYATNTDGPWTNITVDSSTGVVGMYTSITTDGNDKVHISYNDQTNKDLKYATNAGGSWATSTIDSYSPIDYETSIAVDSKNKVHISYNNESDTALMYATNSAGVWTTKNIDNGSDAGHYSSIVIGPNDKVHISYICNSCHQLRYATNAAGSWRLNYPDSSMVDGYTSIELDQNGKAHISYKFDNNLKYVNGTSGDPSPWPNKVVVDDRSSTGMYSSLEINSVGALIIAYYDGNNSDLNLAFRASKPSAPTLVAATPGNDQVSLSWTAPSTDGGSTITGYKVYRGDIEGSESLLTTLGQTLSYVDSIVSNGQTYFYKVAAVNGVGEGSRSNSVNATPATTPSAPRNLTAMFGNEYVQLNWETPSSNGGSTIINYQVWRATGSGAKTPRVLLGTVFSFNDTDVDNGDTYYYTVKAINSIGSSVDSNQVTANPATVPNAPTGLMATSGDAFVSLEWTAPSDDGGKDVTGYTLFRGSVSGEYSESFSLGNVLTYNDTSLTNGQRYYYAIAAVNAIGEGSRSSEVFSTPMALPSAPTFTQVKEGDAEVHLEWSAPIDGGSDITSYRLYRNESGGSSETIVLGTVLSYTDVGLINGHTYSYRLSAVNGVGEGPLSAQVSAVPVTVPSAPMNLQAMPGNSSVSLSWEAPIYSGPGQITYHLFRDDIEIWNGSGTGHVDSGLVNEMTYTYNIAAENEVGWGPNSTSVEATPSEVVLPPTAPLNLLALPGNGLVQLSWEAPDYVGMLPLTYHVFRDGVLLWSGSDLGISDDDVSKGVEYVYSVAAESQIGWGANCSSVSATPFGVPATPGGLEGTSGDGQALIVWSAVVYSGPGVLTYHLLRDGTEVYNGSVTSFNDVGLTNGQSYLYVLSATNSIGSSAFSDALLVTPVGPPSEPNELVASSGDGWVRLSWSPPTYEGTGPISYHIFRNGSLLWSGEGSAHNDTTVHNNQNYSYVVAARNAIGWGPNSTSVSARPEGPETVIPGPPSGLVANASNGKVQLTWQAPSDGASSVTGYNVYRKTGSGSWELIASVNGTSYEDDDVTNGQEYSYKVSSIGSGGEGEPTESAVIIPQSPDSNDDEGNDMLLFLGIGVLAIAAVLGLLFVLRRKKK